MSPPVTCHEIRLKSCAPTWPVNWKVQGYLRKRQNARSIMTNPALWTTVDPGFKKESGAKRTRSKSGLNRAAYNAAAHIFLSNHRKCFACLRIGKRQLTATQVHHQRGRLGSLLMDERFWIPVCAGCHDFIHNNISVARRLGLICEAGKWNVPEKNPQLTQTAGT